MIPRKIMTARTHGSLLACVATLVLTTILPAQETSLIRTNTSDSATVASTIANGANIPLGAPRTIRWSIARDGARLPTAYYAGSDPNRPSLLIADLDNDFAVPSGSRGTDLTTRPWFPFLTSMFDRIAKKTGLGFIYEPNDDGASIGTDGAIGVRGDLRIAGGPLTGALGYNGIPNNSTQPDMVLNTSHAWNGNDLRFISNHEYHHGLGFGHVEVENNGNASAVAASGGNSNGPQFHDLIQLHRKYGDPYEKPSRNETRATATDLGGFGFWSARTVGSNWDDIWIGADETDFATISATNDADFFKIETTGPMVLRARLTPRGPVYSYASEGQAAATVDASRFMNLRIEVQDASGTAVATASAQPAGSAEELPAVNLPSSGTWFFRVGIDGSSSSPQAYRLELADPAMPTGLVTSFNTDGNFEGWTAYNSVNTRTVSGGALNGTISGSDPQVRRENLSFAGSSVPRILIRVKSSVTGGFQMFWGRAGADSYAGERSLTLNITQANAWTLLDFNPSAHAQWAGQTVTRIRLDPPGGSGATFNIDYIIGPDDGTTLAWQSGAAPGGSGDWNTSNNNWQLAGNTSAWLSGSRALFRGTAGTVNLAGNTTAAGLDFQTTGYTLGGIATLNLAAGADLAVTSGTATLACPLTGTTAAKTGAGTLLVTAAPPELAGIDLQAGTMAFQPPVDGSLTAILSGPGAITKEGASTLTLGGANTFTGAVTVNTGALRLTRSDSLGTGTKLASISNGSAGQSRIILAGGASPIVLPSGISFRSSNNHPDFPAVLNESGNNTIQGNFNLTSGGGGTRFTSQAGLLTLTGTMTPGTPGRVMHLDGAGEGSFSGILQDQNTTNTAALDKAGPGTWTISGANTYTGATTITNGTLSLAGGNDRLPVTTTVTLGNAQTSGILRLDSRSQTLAGLLTSGTGTSNRVINGSATPATLTINNPLSQTFPGSLGGATPNDNNFSLAKSGAGTLILAGSNNHSGNTLVKSGTLAVTTGGTIAAGAANTSLTVADGTAPAAFSITGGSVSSPRVNIGGSTATAAAVLTIHSGSLSSTGELWVGSNAASPAFGALNIHGGTVSTGSWLALGRGSSGSTTTPTRGLLAMTAGTLNVNGGNLSIGAFQLNPAAASVMSLSGGNVTTTNGVFVGEHLSGVLDMSGGTLTTGTTSGVRLKTTGTGTGIFNLRGGTLTTGFINAGTGGTGILNLNGGTLRPSQHTTTFLQGVQSAHVFAGGLNIDTNGFDITIAQNLTAPAANGLASIAVSGGTGYLAPPVVEITGGGGSGATAAATIDANGSLTGITVTNPGSGYTSTPAVTLGGGGGNGAVIGTVTLAPNSSGGITKTGAGTLVLTGASTFTGSSAVQAGTLLVNGSLAAAVTASAAGTFGGSGTLGGLTIAATGPAAPAIAPGHNGIGKLSVIGTATLGSRARFGWEIRDWNGIAGTGSDLLEAAHLVLAATPAAPLVITISPNQLANFTDTARSFVIARGTSSITGFNPAAIQIDSSAFPAAGSWSARQTGTSLELTYTPSGYDSWIAGSGLTGPAAAPAADPDADGLANLIEFVLGTEPNPANPASPSASSAPTLAVTPSHITFSFRRSAAAASQPDLSITVEYSPDLSSWTPAVHGSHGISITSTNDAFAPGIERVDVSIPRHLAPAGSLLLRLKARYAR